MQLKYFYAFILSIIFLVGVLAGCYHLHVSMGTKSERERMKDGERFVDITETNEKCEAFGPCPGC